MIALKVLVVSVLVAVAAAETPTTYSSSLPQVENYINAHRRQYAANILSYDEQIQTLKDVYTSRVKTININRNLLKNSLLKSEERLNPLELLNDQSQVCIDKYISLIPSVAAITYNMDKCVSQAISQLNNVVYNLVSTNATLQNYYTNTYEGTIKSCERSYPYDAPRYTTCVESAVTSANAYTINNQRTFSTQLANAYTSGDIYVKLALDCSFAEQKKAMSSTAQANILIDKCRQGLDNCNNRSGYYCEDVYDMPASSINTKSQTMGNVFYGSNPSIQCLMLKAY